VAGPVGHLWGGSSQELGGAISPKTKAWPLLSCLLAPPSCLPHASLMPHRPQNTSSQVAAKCSPIACARRARPRLHRWSLLVSSDSSDASRSSHSPPHLWLVLFFGLGPPDQQAKRGACSQDALMLESWLERARLLWLGRLRMVVRSASTGSVLPVVASLHIHPASETPTQLGLVLVH
jgi:hypothetical protein